MILGQKVFFLREKPPGLYNYNKPEIGEIVKIGKSIVFVKLSSTGVTHRFKIDGLSDASYTYHKLFLTQDDLDKESMSERMVG